MSDDLGAPGAAPRALLLGAGLVLLAAALLYNELVLAPLAREAFTPLTRSKIRAVELGFGLAGAVLIVLSEGVRRSRRLAGWLSGRVPSIGLLVLAGLLPILLLDFGLRPFVDPKTSVFVEDPELGWRMRPDAVGEWGGVEVRVNRRGLRGPAVEDRKPPGVRRLLFLGDSVTFGFGVAEVDEVFPSRVGRSLEEALGKSVEVVNAGVGGYSPWQELAFLEREGLRYAPDLVVIGFVLNDVTEKLALVRYGGSERGWQLARTARSRLDHWLSRSALATAAREGFAVLRFGRDVRLGAQAAEMGAVRRLVTDPASFERAWRITLDNVRRIVLNARERGIPSLLVIFPYAFQLEAPGELSGPQRRLVGFANGLGVPAVDLLPTLAALGAEAAFLDGSHLSVEGHARVGEVIADRILEESLFGKARSGE
jgi:lysophospholipase L1-like esterase